MNHSHRGSLKPNYLLIANLRAGIRKGLRLPHDTYHSHGEPIANMHARNVEKSGFFGILTFKDS